MSEKVSGSITEEDGTDASPDDTSNGDTSERELHTADLVQQADRATTATQAPETSEDAGTPLLGDTEEYRRRWEAVQTGFVDEPRRAVENADALVAEVMQELASSFADERNGLESQWSEGDQVSTEDLRVSLRRYRSFFDRLLTT
jgi:hypothetical protein